ncbi:MAG: PQQ-dependent sugar dehydrogenase, partial [Pseudomonadales bacterium]
MKLPFWQHPNCKVAAFVLAPAILAAVLLLLEGHLVHGGERSQSASSIISTSHHIVEIAEFDIGSLTGARSSASGGGIAFDRATGEYLLVRPNGEIYRFRFASDGKHLELADTGMQVPINHESFAADNIGIASGDAFRVADVLILGDDADRRILVSHHYWLSDQSCFVVRLSQHAFPQMTRSERISESQDAWTTLFESTPCLPVGLNRGTAFAGVQIGGNLELAPTGRILFAVGDHQFDGWYRARNLVEDMTSEYGKVISIDPSSGDYEIFTTGHRNPQGLVVTESGQIWETEHGPQGGDELNLLSAGRNYGYPFHSLGTEYGGVTWPPGNQTDLDTAIKVSPVYAWIPSIGISDLIEINGSDFPRWRGNLLVAALRDKA